MRVHRISLASFLFSIVLFAKTSHGVEPSVCSNTALLTAIRIIDGACTDLYCDFSRLSELNSRVDKGALLKAFLDRDIQSIHLFFPSNQSSLASVFDWNTSKKDQLASLRYMNDPEDSIIYVLGRASITGTYDQNVGLSRDRMKAIMDYLKGLGLPCHRFRGAWFGKTIQQFTTSDAAFVRIPSVDYRNDELILNQSVHVFVFPCKGKV